MSNITEVQREEMIHALGLNYDSKPTRNYFFTDADDSDWNDLVSKGYARKRPGWDEESAYYIVTDEGKKALGVSVDE